MLAGGITRTNFLFPNSCPWISRRDSSRRENCFHDPPLQIICNPNIKGGRDYSPHFLLTGAPGGERLLPARLPAGSFLCPGPVQATHCKKLDAPAARNQRRLRSWPRGLAQSGHSQTGGGLRLRL